MKDSAKAQNHIFRLIKNKSNITEKEIVNKSVYTKQYTQTQLRYLLKNKKYSIYRKKIKIGNRKVFHYYHNSVLEKAIKRKLDLLIV